ncbi:MAG: formate dehydrogenase accessory protein FdhE [Anaerolineales bacterium]|nr:formate dehydrogenase accessory protein FdhE [Anaerolineales bacterium]
MPYPASEQLVIKQIKRKRDQSPDQAEVLDLQIALLEAQIEADIPPLTGVLTAEQATERRRAGIPLVTPQNLALDWDAFSTLFRRVCRITAQYRSDLAESLGELERLVDENPEGVKAWINQLLVGDALQGIEQPGLEIYCLTHTLRPFMRNYARTYGPLVDEKAWKRKYCPICGGEADFGALSAKDEGARYLLCSRCDYEWLYKRIGCPFCENDDHTKIKYFPEESGPHRLYVCDNCLRYIKVIDVREAAGDVALPAERVTTIAMDVAAQDQGYS